MGMEMGMDTNQSMENMPMEGSMAENTTRRKAEATKALVTALKGMTTITTMTAMTAMTMATTIIMR